MPSLVSGEAEKRALLAIRETPASEPFAEAVVRGLEAAAPLIAAQALRRLAVNLCQDGPNCPACYETRGLLFDHADDLEKGHQ